MNRETYDSLIATELEQAIRLLQEQFPQLAGREVRLKSILTPLVANVAAHTRTYELLGLKTAREMAAIWNVSERRARAFIAAQHARWEIGRQIEGAWVLSADEAARYRPGPPGKPKSS